MSLSDYLVDFRTGWRPLLACSLGLSSGMALHPFVMNVIAPHVVQAMGWSKADFALAAMVSGLAILSYPVVGRLADRFGVRLVGGTGIVATSLSYVAIAMLDGPIGYYVAILILQLSLGAMTTGPVFLRMVVRSFDRSRGAALAIAVSAPPFVAILASPLLAALVDARGWRIGSLTVAAYAIVAGFSALALIPRDLASATSAQAHGGGSHTNMRALLANRPYRILLATTVLVSVPLVMTNSQLALVLINNGMTMAAAGSTIGLFAFGTVAGRLSAGLALDRIGAEIVGAVAFSLPAVGMLLLASPFDHPAILGLSILAIGLAFGAEGDILAYMVSRQFGLDNYGTALGIVFAAVGTATMLGAFVLSQSLRLWGGYTGFLIFGSISVVLGSALLLSLRPRAGRDVTAGDEASDAAITASSR